MSIIKYDTGTGGLENWLVEESAFDPSALGKCEAIFCQGNGYMGVRHALEEDYVGHTRNTFVTGTFNKFDENEVTELPNIPDMTKAAIYIDGTRFSLEQGTMEGYSRTMNLRTGEVIRRFRWKNGAGKSVDFEFHRMVSMAREHVMAAKINICPVDAPVNVKIVSGIDGQVANSGSQHFSEGSKRIYDYTYLEMISKTTQSHVTAAMHCAHKFLKNGETAKADLLPIIGRREIKISASMDLNAGDALCIEKYSTVHTTRDMAYDAAATDVAVVRLGEDSRQEIIDVYKYTYDELLAESAGEWEKLWQAQDIIVTSQNAFDQLAIRFAIYHLNIMVKKDDSRVGIGAKAMSGEGYKGHSFWDTEVFILPYYMLTQPDTARTLLEYRYKNLFGAHKKAQENGFDGAMYPWESAWIDDGEVTPLWGAADVVTGETLPILTGMIEQHITADIAFAVWQYYIATADDDFMERFGYEIIMDTAKFWVSRLEWNETLDRYEINDVIGPDEYSEHVDNNAYTNYLAGYNMKLAGKLMDTLLDTGNPKLQAVYERLDKKLDLQALKTVLAQKLPKLYLPQPDPKTGIIPQFDGYFDLKHIDLKKYKESSVVGTIYNDYNMEQLGQMQVLKQSDVVVLLYLLDDLFDVEIKKQNYFYYEERTLHDSSLSKSTHSVVANDMGLHDVAYRFFQGASTVDLGAEMHSSDAGIHSASMGGIWQAAILGFGGVRIVGEQLRIAPSLPKAWTSLDFNIVWHGQTLHVSVNESGIRVTNCGDAPVDFLLCSEPVTLLSGDTVNHDCI